MNTGLGLATILVVAGVRRRNLRRAALIWPLISVQVDTARHIQLETRARQAEHANREARLVPGR